MTELWNADKVSVKEENTSQEVKQLLNHHPSEGIHHHPVLGYRFLGQGIMTIAFKLMVEVIVHRLTLQLFSLHPTAFPSFP
jgi:hypothetical protein